MTTARRITMTGDRRHAATWRTAGLRTAQLLAVPLGALTMWQVASGLGLLNTAFFPPPTRIAAALKSMTADGSLLHAAGLTAGRAVLGLVVAVIVAVPLGVLIATNPVADALTLPVREFLRVLPTVTVVPALMVVLGVGTGLTVSAVAFAAFGPVLLGTVHGVRGIDATLLDVARVHRLGSVRTAVRVRLPSAAAEIATAVRISLAIALVVALVVEMLTGNGGLGAEVIEARSRFRTADVFAIVAVMGVLGFILNAAMVHVESRFRRS